MLDEEFKPNPALRGYDLPAMEWEESFEDLRALSKDLKPRQRITFKCSECGKEVTFALDRVLLKGSLLCKSCHTKKTCFDKYGVINPSQIEGVQEKIKENLRAKYGEGVTSTSQVPGAREKAKQTMIERYGDYYTRTQEYKDRSEKTNLEKYGTRIGSMSEIVKENAKKHNLEKWGVDNPAKDPSIKKKIKDHFLDTYGVVNPSQIEEVQKKNWAVRRPRVEKKITKQCEDRNITPLFDFSKDYKGEKSYYKFVCNNCGLEFEAKPFNRTICCPVCSSSASGQEMSLRNFIVSIYEGPILYNVKDVISPLELDIYIPEKKLAIEYNGDYWHSTEQKEKRYHEIKSKACEAKGIRLIHIYECEWIHSREKIESLLRIALGCGYSKIGARKCEVKKISNREARPFNEKNHLQGHRNAQVTYGLFYKGELVQLMSFSKMKYNRNLKGNDEWEIIRGCPGSNNQIVGGVSKLFKAFIKEYNPQLVFSYCDFNKFDGRGYEAIGMKFVGYTGPDKFYIDRAGYKIGRNPKKRKELEESCTTIYGAGSKKYIWKLN